MVTDAPNLVNPFHCSVFASVVYMLEEVKMNLVQELYCMGGWPHIKKNMYNVV